RGSRRRGPGGQRVDTGAERGMRADELRVHSAPRWIDTAAAAGWWAEDSGGVAACGGYGLGFFGCAATHFVGSNVASGIESFTRGSTNCSLKTDRPSRYCIPSPA